MPEAYEVRLSKQAARTFERIPEPERSRIRTALLELAETASRPSRVGGKKVKTIKGVADMFHRLRVGDVRVMYDVLPEEHVVLVLGIVDRADLERWLSNR